MFMLIGKRALVAVYLLLATAVSLFAQQPVLPKTSNGYYVIASDEDYETFRQIVATGNPYANAVLTADVKTCGAIGAGDAPYHYRGTFDGQGHTVTLSISNQHETEMVNSCGMFEYTEAGCVIRNVMIAGELSSPTNDIDHMGSIVCDATGTKIENCISSVTMGGMAKCYGGLVGISRGECFIENCAFIGTIPSSNMSCGIVGHNTQVVSIKSCYVAPQHSGSGNGYILADKMDANETGLNNYYCTDRMTTGLVTDGQKGQSISMYDIKSGSLCYMLNKNGRKGLIWYQHGDYPYPFKGTDGKVIISEDLGNSDFKAVDSCPGLPPLDNGYCIICGDAYEQNTLPLQQGGQSVISASTNYKGTLYVDNIEYQVDIINNVATVLGLHIPDGAESNDVKAIHIPETVKTFKGNVCNVVAIAEDAFKNCTSLEYCYLPKTISQIPNNAFAGCTSLSHLHIADATKAQVLEIGYDTDGDKPMFKDSPLKKLYIGRNVAWDADHREPFRDVNGLEEITWGPAVTRIGNSMNLDARQGNAEIFGNSSGVLRVMFMGTEESLDDELEAWCGEGMSLAKTCYINRNLKGDYVYLQTQGSGIIDNCWDMTYGPFVKTITKGPEYVDSYGEFTSRNLQTVDFSNAFNLVTIESRAFSHGTHIKNIDLRNTKVETIGDRAFDNVRSLQSVLLSKNLKTIGKRAFHYCRDFNTLCIPGTVTTIGEEAFRYCEGIESLTLEDGDEPLPLGSDRFSYVEKIDNIYIGRNITGFPYFGTKKSTLFTIGPKVTRIMEDIFVYHSNYYSLHILHSDTPLVFEGNHDNTFESLFVDRDIVNDEGTANIPWIRKSIEQNKLKDLTFGENIKVIPDNMYAGATELHYLIIPANVTTIGEQAFRNCPNLEMISIMGAPEVKASAFSGCNELKFLYLMGDKIKLENDVFANCKDIDEVIVNFPNDPGQSSETAFHPNVYDNASLLMVNDKDNIGVNFESNPWIKFVNKGVPTNNYRGKEDEFYGNFVKASLPHHFKAGCYELVYLPFDMDSYYFGSDATVYRVQHNGDRYVNEVTTEETSNLTPPDAYVVDNIKLAKVDIDTEKILTRDNQYLIKVNHYEELMAAYYNLYNQDNVLVDNTTGYRYGYEGNGAMYHGAGWACNWTDSYTADEGVIKYINGDYEIIKPGQVFITGNGDEGREEGKEYVFNMIGNESTIMTSKIDLAFNSSLEGYASFYAADYNYIAPEWCDVYVVTSIDGKTILMEQIPDRTITKGQAVLLKSNQELGAGITEYLTYATHGSMATDLYDNNLLKGVNVDTPANQLSPEHGFVYVLSCTAGKNTGFYKLSGDRVMPTGKAYLDPNSIDSSSLSKACLFVCDNSVVTGIAIPKTSNINLKAVYDLMGRRLRDAGYRGIYIINNKKIIK